MSWFDWLRTRPKGERRRKLLTANNSTGPGSKEEKSGTVIPATANAVLNEPDKKQETIGISTSCGFGCGGCGGDCGGGCGPCH